MCCVSVGVGGCAVVHTWDGCLVGMFRSNTIAFLNHVSLVVDQLHGDVVNMWWGNTCRSGTICHVRVCMGAQNCSAVHGRLRNDCPAGPIDMHTHSLSQVCMKCCANETTSPRTMPTQRLCQFLSLGLQPLFPAPFSLSSFNSKVP